MDGFVDWLVEDAPVAGQLGARTVESGREATYGRLDLSDRIAKALAAQGIDRLYAHQVDAIDAVREGDNVVVATPTASGKSLVYTIPAIEGALHHGQRTLYIAPLRALINDQEAALSDFVADLGFGPQVTVAQYTGQL